MNLTLLCVIALTITALAAAEVPTTNPSTATSERVVKDVVYSRSDGEEWKLDIHKPTGTTPTPAVIYVHGGGWMSGDKSADMGFAAFTDAGLTVVSIDYRLAPAHRWPACREDVEAAIGWVKAHAAEQGIDTNRLAIMGYSAGGHLAMDAATRVKDIKAAVGIAAPTDLIIDNYRRQGPSVSMQNLFNLPAAAAGMNLDAAKILYDNSPINHITHSHPPTLLVAGDADKSVPHLLSEHYKDHLEAMGVKCDLITMPSAGHRLSEYQQGWEAQIAKWLATELNVPRN